MATQNKNEENLLLQDEQGDNGCTATQLLNEIRAETQLRACFAVQLILDHSAEQLFPKFVGEDNLHCV